MKDERDYSLRWHNTFGIKAWCRRFLECGSAAEATAISTLLRQEEEGTPLLIIGGGSNLLLTNGYYSGTVVHSAIRGICLTEQSHGEALLRCGSGERWDDVVAWTAGLGFADLVNLSLIPGDVGASAVQNIGAYGAEAAQFVSYVDAVEIGSGQPVRLDAAACGYGYRDSRFKHEWRNRYLITHVGYRLHRGAALRLDYGNIAQELQRRGLTHPTPLQLRQVIIDIRRAKLPDPQELGNAGSFFMNPIVSREHYERLAAEHPQMPHYYIDEQHEKIPAAWLIDQCGWKGKAMGRAAVYDKQALVLVNRGGACGQEIVALCQAIQHDVAARFDIALKPEVNIV